MINSVIVTNHLGDSIELILTEPEKSGFVIRSIEGLGPVNANVHFIELATLDGAIDNSARLGTRNIVLSLIFLRNPTIEDTRLLTYKYFPIKQKITFRIKTDNRDCYAVGRVESNSPTIFDQQEGCQISILCPDSYFKNKVTLGNTFYGIEPSFEFPFSNESVSSPLIQMGNIYNVTRGTIDYHGDAQTGLVIKITATGEAGTITISNDQTTQSLIIDQDIMIDIMGSRIKSGDTVIINTLKGEKGITLLRNGITTNIINTLVRPIGWIQLVRGFNTLTFSATSGINNLKYDIEYDNLYEGV